MLSRRPRAIALELMEFTGPWKLKRVTERASVLDSAPETEPGQGSKTNGFGRTKADKYLRTGLEKAAL